MMQHKQVMVVTSLNGEKVEQLPTNLWQTWILLYKNSMMERKETLCEELWNMKL
jgi:hypothetical protein